MKLLNKLFLFTLFFTACATAPTPIQYGKDACDYCRMTIMDRKFGGEIVTKKGKVYKFDSPECLAHYYNKHQAEAEDIGAILITDHDEPGKMMPIDQAALIRNEAISSPMGGHVAAFSDEASARKAFPGEGRMISWRELIESVQ